MGSEMSWAGKWWVILETCFSGQNELWVLMMLSQGCKWRQLGSHLWRELMNGMGWWVGRAALVSRHGAPGVRRAWPTDILTILPTWLTWSACISTLSRDHWSLGHGNEAVIIYLTTTCLPQTHSAHCSHLWQCLTYLYNAPSPRTYTVNYHYSIAAILQLLADQCSYTLTCWFWNWVS